MTTDIDSHNLQLRRAVRNGDIQRVDEALSAGADPNFVPANDLKNRFPSLHVAAGLGFIAIMERLVAAGANVTLRSELSQQSPLCVAAEFNQLEAGLWLLNNGAELPDKQKSQYAPLSTALENTNLAFADMLLKEFPQLGQNHLENVASVVMGRFDVSVTQWLLDKGVRTDLSSPEFVPWLHKVQSANPGDALALTQMLLKAGADVNRVDLFRTTPLHEAVTVHRPSTMLALLRAGANPDLPDEEGKTVRSLIQETADEELRAAFIAWETSKAAHQIIQSAQAPQDLKSL